MKFYIDIFIDYKHNRVCELYHENNKIYMDNKIWKPSIFYPTKKESQWKDIYGNYQIKKTFNTITEYCKYLKNNHFYNGDVKLETQYIQEHYPKIIDFNISDINSFIIDIETKTDHFHEWDENKQALDPVTIITLYSYKEKKYYVIGYKDNVIKHDYNYEYIKVNNEKELLLYLIKFFKDKQIELITGWNSCQYDIPYIIERIKKVWNFEVAKELSPFKKINVKEYKDFDKNYYTFYNIVGIIDLDYMRLYKKYHREKQERYSLNHISKIELGKQKIDYINEYKNLNDLYEYNFDKYVEYNIKDVELVKLIDDKMKYVDLHLTSAYSSKINISDAFFSSFIWDGSIYNELMNNNIIVPGNKQNDSESYKGAYIKEIQKGLHKWVLSFDVNSLYPNLMIAFNISPETLIEQRKEYNYDDKKYINKEIKLPFEHVMTGNGCYFSRDKQGVIPKIMEKEYNERKENQKLYNEYKDKDINLASKYNNIQYYKKNKLTSGYGVLANKYFRFYDRKIAESVTKMGRILIQLIEKNVNNYLNKIYKRDFVVYIHTDSIYVTLNDIINLKHKDSSFEKKLQFVYEIEKHIQNIIDKSLIEYCDYWKTFKNSFKMKREKICNATIFIKKSKYVLSIIDNEGEKLDNPKITYTGIEIVRNDTPEIIKEKLKDTVKYILEYNDVNKLMNYINEYKKEFIQLDVNDIAKPTGIKGINNYIIENGYKKATPIHVRAAILYNALVNKLNLNIPYIKNNDKIKYIYLKTPNPLNENVIGWINGYELPKEFKLNDYIDYDLQFVKVYKKPVINLINSMNWNIEKQFVNNDDIFE